MKNNNNERKSQLEERGWERKFIIEDHRVNEYIELYESLNQEVRVEPVIPSEIEGCNECFKVECSNFRVIYTRTPIEVRDKEN